MLATVSERLNLVSRSLCFLIVLAAGPASAQQLTPAQVERQIVGTYELAEWHFEGEVLKPPVVNGRLVFHNGQTVAMFRRDKDGTAYDFAGYGSYTVNKTVWSYGYDYRLEVTEKGGQQSVVHATREQIPHACQLEGSNLVCDYRNGERRFVFGPDDLTYSEMGQVLRRWRRLKSGF
jgi:hypothetical protein